MALRPLLRRRAVVTAAATIVAGATFFPPRLVHAEASEEEIVRRARKSIYDDEPLLPPSAVTEAPPASVRPPPTPSASKSPTPTDRLAEQIKRLRLALHSSAIKAEDAANDALTETLRLERSFTSTIASLAPPKESNERILPNGLYVLISAMGTQILTRNRSLPVRFTLPLLVGITTANAVLPQTMTNVGDLIWTYEKKYPAIAENHIRIKEKAIHIWESGKAHSAMTVVMLEDKVGEARETVEGWVRKGK